MKIYQSVAELVGHTPLLEYKRVEENEKLNGRLIAKLESFNPAGSAKDRIGLAMIEEAEKEGKIKKGSIIIEPTSGNTGIGLCAIAAVKGYRTIIVMPDTMSVERINLIKAYGGEVVLTDGAKGMTGAIEKAKEIERENPGSFIAGQFTNPVNPKAHFETTGPEIWEDTDGNVDYFVAGIGTGGTITGVGRYLKSKNSNVKIIAVEPKSSPVLTKGISGQHGIQGIGANFVPEILDTSILDEIIDVEDEAAFETGRMIGRTEGTLVGISSGAALWAAIQVAKREEARGKNIVVLLPDTGDRYLSTAMFS
ncbi:MAG TPA: cysteine synthase A [Lachnospiraceae bacterium]|jgi:cysteine synthase A|nr:cysteine synthase A [Lachnospiraceae bacterium]